MARDDGSALSRWELQKTSAELVAGVHVGEGGELGGLGDIAGRDLITPFALLPSEEDIQKQPAGVRDAISGGFDAPPLADNEDGRILHEVLRRLPVAGEQVRLPEHARVLRHQVLLARRQIPLHTYNDGLDGQKVAISVCTATPTLYDRNPLIFPAGTDAAAGGALDVEAVNTRRRGLG